MKRIFLIVLDSFGIGQMPDSAAFGDVGVNTLASCAATGQLHIPNMLAAGLGNIDGVDCLPKAAAPTPKPAANTAKKRSADPKVLSRWLYCLAMWGTFCATVCVLLGISFFLSQRTTIGNGAIAIVAIGIPIAIFLTVMLHKKDKLTVWIRSVKRGNMIQKFLLWLVLGVGIFVVLVIIGGLTYLQLVGQESFTQDNIKLLAVISGALSLGIMSGWLKKFVF